MKRIRERVSGVPQPASTFDKLFTVLIVCPYNDYADRRLMNTPWQRWLLRQDEDWGALKIYERT